MKWFIGCSGFNYHEWKGNFYPKEVKIKDWLTYYSTRFNSVELNGTFYRFPVVRNLQRFYQHTPADFAFSAKVHRIITHHMRLKNAKDKVSEYMSILEEGLQEKLHCVLFQLPGSFKFSDENLERVLETIPAKPGYVVEFRDSSWWREEVFKALRRNSITFCNVSFPGLSEERHFTSKFVYMRFHGVPILFQSPYTKKDLERMKQSVPSGAKSCYVYFNNTAAGNAHRNATTFKKIG